MMPALIASQLPLAGSVIAMLLLPALTLALMAATAQAARPEKPTMRAIFQAALLAVRADARPMAVLGVMYAALFFTVMAISALADGGQFARVYLLGEPLTLEMAEATGFQVAMWITLALYLPLSMAFWHAPALAHWHRVPPAKSLFFSFVACFKNFGALIVFAMIWMGVLIGTSIALSLLTALLGGLGAAEGADVPEAGYALMLGGALVMAAMFFTSTWFTFRDSFNDEADVEG
jgi:hypothetical protein